MFICDDSKQIYRSACGCFVNEERAVNSVSWRFQLGSFENKRPWENQWFWPCSRHFGESGHRVWLCTRVCVVCMCVCAQRCACVQRCVTVWLCFPPPAVGDVIVFGLHPLCASHGLFWIRVTSITQLIRGRFGILSRMCPFLSATLLVAMISHDRNKSYKTMM